MHYRPLHSKFLVHLIFTRRCSQFPAQLMIHGDATVSSEGKPLNVLLGAANSIFLPFMLSVITSNS